jgi:hypothetical protein
MSKAPGSGLLLALALALAPAHVPNARCQLFLRFLPCTTYVQLTCMHSSCTTGWQRSCTIRRGRSALLSLFCRDTLDTSASRQRRRQPPEAPPAARGAASRRSPCPSRSPCSGLLRCGDATCATKQRGPRPRPPPVAAATATPPEVKRHL